MGKENCVLRKTEGRKCLVVEFRSHYLEERDSRETTLSRRQWRELLYAFGRPLVPSWDEGELYEEVDRFLDGVEM